MISANDTRARDGKQEVAPLVRTCARLARYLLWPIWAVGVVAWAGMAIELDSSFASAPLLAAFGFMAALIALVGRYPAAAFVALSYFWTCMFLGFVANYIGWDSNILRPTMAILGAAYLLTMMRCTRYALDRAPSPYAEWQCRVCGYDLSGSESGCCPECGTRPSR